MDGAHRDHRDHRHVDHRDVPDIVGGVPWNDGFEWKFVNYTPLLVGGVLILLWIYWHASVKNWFTGPIKQVDETGEQLEGVPEVLKRASQGRRRSHDSAFPPRQVRVRSPRVRSHRRGTSRRP